jgi:hypothetical protein
MQPALAETNIFGINQETPRADDMAKLAVSARSGRILYAFVSCPAFYKGTILLDREPGAEVCGQGGINALVCLVTPMAANRALSRLVQSGEQVGLPRDSCVPQKLRQMRIAHTDSLLPKHKYGMPCSGRHKLPAITEKTDGIRL